MPGLIKREEHTGLVQIRVRVNGEWVGHTTVPERASLRDKELAALSMPAVQRAIGEATVKGFSTAERDVVHIVT